MLMITKQLVRKILKSGMMTFEDGHSEDSDEDMYNEYGGPILSTIKTMMNMKSTGDDHNEDMLYVIYMRTFFHDS